MELVPDEKTRSWLLTFWEMRSQVTGATRCPTPLVYENGRQGRCVLSRAHQDGETIGANVPHCDKDGRLAPLLVSWETIREARLLSGQERDYRS